MPIRVTCPHCQVVLNAPEGVIGKAVKCKKCGNVFTAEAPEASPPPKTIAPPPLPRSKRDDDELDEPRPSRRSSERASSRRDDELDDDRRDRDGGERGPSRHRDRSDDESNFDFEENDRPRSRAHRGRPKKKSPVLLYVLLGVGALFLLCTGGGGVAIYLATSEGAPRDFTVQEGCVSAKLAGNPKRSVKPNGQIHYEVEFWRSAYVIVLQPIDQLVRGRPGPTNDEAKFVMQLMENNFVGGPGQTVIRKTQITYQGFPSVEIEMRDSSGVSMIYRAFLTSRYVVVVGFGSRGELDRTRATQFLDSVKILDPRPGRLN